ncbi:DUF2059 domain-containing protein [Hymenobacter aerilatus]|uniref:DUF2059 domain-containing protein n=1 Tax=Hymenobacter aerilatus TaxID=2932251 RepID=A0A8T9SVA2_9BACT|nr:DUF2059 domain-containing protein [Hymenobacter aerilatus]UOR05825.1 DUF2059 domain-containing protein [Hymenobacter aerilatus]
MKHYIVLLACGLLLTAPAAVAQTKSAKGKTTKPAAAATTPVPAPVAAEPIPAAQRQAAETLFGTMQMDKNMTTMMEQMLDMQVKQNPQLQTVEPEMRAFFNKYMSWTALREDMVQVYAREFTASELQDLNRFYQTPTGQKYISKQTSLMQEGMLIAQRRVQEHMPELQQTIMQKLGQGQSTE